MIMTLIYAKKNWVDTSASGTSITASDLNKFENAINNLTNTVNNLSKVQYYASDYPVLWKQNAPFTGYAAHTALL